VRNGRVFAIDGNQYFNRSGPRLVESAEILASLLFAKDMADGVDHTSWQNIADMPMTSTSSPRFSGETGAWRCKGC
jgi:hypothetical protein